MPACMRVPAVTSLTSKAIMSDRYALERRSSLAVASATWRFRCAPAFLAAGCVLATLNTWCL